MEYASLKMKLLQLGITMYVYTVPLCYHLLTWMVRSCLSELVASHMLPFLCIYDKHVTPSIRTSFKIRLNDIDYIDKQGKLGAKI